MRALITNCPNCGAPLKDGKCLYCDTHVRLANEIDIDRFSDKPTEIMLNIKNGDEVILLPLVGRIDSINMTLSMSDMYPEVTLTFSGFVKEG